MKHINLFYSLAAALVILGAMGKILHYSWSDTVLKISLTTEALVFVVMGVTDWVTYRREEVAALPKQEGVVADASGLESSITELNSTIKKVFNHG